MQRKNKKTQIGFLHSPHERGFSLLEVIIVIAIVAIITVISFKLLGRAKTNTQDDSACNDLAALLNKARNYALTGKCSGGGASIVSVSVSGSIVSISGGDCNETSLLSNGAVCTGGPWGFTIPDGVKTGASTAVCGSKSVIIDRHKATCR